jgi:hypothetical protein
MNEFPGPGQQPTAGWPVRVRLVWDARISPPVTRGLMQDERDWFRALVSPDSSARKVVDVQDFTLSRGGGFAVDSPELPKITVRRTADAINVLLAWAAWWAEEVLAGPVRHDTPVRARLVWDAAIRPPVIREWGEDEQDPFVPLAGPAGWPKPVRTVDAAGEHQAAAFTLSAGDGFVVDNPELPKIAVGRTADVINVLLVPARPDPSPPSSPWRFRAPFAQWGRFNR